jgi:sulfofructose kinase
MTSSTDVLVIGRSCLDNFAVVDRFPRENEKASLESRFMEGGGQGGTASCCIARLGGRVTYVGKLGDDPAGRFCLKRLEDYNVETGNVEMVPGGKTPEAFLFITRKTGARTIIYEHSELPKITLTPHLQSIMEQTAVLLLDPETTYLAKFLKQLKKENIKIVYDCETRRDGLEEMMALADYFIPSIDFLNENPAEAGTTLRQGIEYLNARVSGTLIVTDGLRGAYFLDQGLFQVRPPKVKVVDTTGAGDNFHAAFALALARGFGLPRAVKFSVAVASLSCRGYGGRQGLPTWEEAMAAAESLELRPL